MHVLSKLLVAAAVLILAMGCGRAEEAAPGEEPPPGAAPGVEVSPPENEEAANDDAGSELPLGGPKGLPKEDYARLRGELDCVKLHFGDDTEGHDSAVAAILQRYDTTAQWLAEVDALMATSPEGKRILADAAVRKEEVCPDGKISAEDLPKLNPLPAGTPK